jgi:hypothetical protein
MAVSGNTGLDYQRDQLLTMSLQLSGQLNAGRQAKQADLEMAATYMNLELMTLQAEGVILRTVERTTKALTDGTASYTLATDTIDLEPGTNGQAGVVAASGESDTVVRLISRSEYQDISDKTVEGRPTVCYVEKQATTKLLFWPVPDDDYTFSYSRVRLINDMDSGAVTMDLARRWLQAITFAVASQIALAKSMPIDLAGYLRSEAERMKAICRADDTQRGSMRFRLVHRGRYW